MSDADAVGLDAAGPTDAPTIVFLHGAVFTRKEWVPQRDALAEEFRVLSPDLPGHGERADEDFAMERAVAVTDEAVAAAEGDSIALVGLSLGGYVATVYAAQHLDRIDGLVVAGASANPVGGLGILTKVLGGVVRLATKSERIRRRLEAAAAEWVRDQGLPAERAEEIVDAGFFPRQFGVAGPYLAGRDFRAEFASFPGPTLVCNGENDDLMRRGEDAHVAAGRDARLVVFDDAGHVSNIEAPSRFTDAVRRFVRERVGTAESGD